MKSFKINHQI